MPKLTELQGNEVLPNKMEHDKYCKNEIGQNDCDCDGFNDCVAEVHKIGVEFDFEELAKIIQLQRYGIYDKYSYSWPLTLKTAKAISTSKSVLMITKEI